MPLPKFRIFRASERIVEVSVGLNLNWLPMLGMAVDTINLSNLTFNLYPK